MTATGLPAGIISVTSPQPQVILEGFALVDDEVLIDGIPTARRCGY